MAHKTMIIWEKLRSTNRTLVATENKFIQFQNQSMNARLITRGCLRSIDTQKSLEHAAGPWLIDVLIRLIAIIIGLADGRISIIIFFSRTSF